MTQKYPIVLFLFLLISFAGKGQSPSQQLYGRVLQQESLQPVAGAQLILSGPKQQFQALTDSAGSYLFEGLQPGRYQLRVSHVAYQKKFIPEVEVKASRPERLLIYLQERELLLQEAEVRPGLAGTLDNIDQTRFTIEETQRFPATFFDPARLVVSQPGVTTANDQTNQLSVHGQSPNHVGWQVEGLEILNPNHLPNAGNASDRSAASGGGVNILSGQLMNDSYFYTGSLPASMGNSLGGIFDINFRPGSVRQRSHTLQAGLMGIDLATEGPLNRKKKSSYLVNYRYSTVGLLSQLGVNFGNEEIKYQDLAFHLNWEETALGKISVFGFGGLSVTNLSPLEDPESWEKDKDGQWVNFDAGMGMLGIDQQLSLSKKASLQNGFAYSGRFSNRQSQTFTRTFTPYEATLENILQDLYAFKSRLNIRHSTRLSSEIGISVNHYRTSLETIPGNIAPSVSLFDQSLSFTSFQPFAELRYAWSRDWLLTSGIRLLADTRNKKLYPEPRMQLLRQLTESSKLQLSYSLLSQPMLNQPHLLPALRYQPISRQTLEPAMSHYGALGYEKSWHNHTTIKTKAFYQGFFQVPTSTAVPAFSALNTVEEYALWPLENTGQGKIYGLDASVQRYFTGDFYYLLSLSLFDATYQGADGQWRNMRFNSQHSLSLTGGREWMAQKADYQRIWGLHLRALYRGGYWYTPIDVAASQQARTTVLDYSQAFSKQLPGYFSLDLRLSHTKEKQNYRRIWSLDIQNASMQKNIGWYYYDQLQEKIKPAYQLGIIPVLAYRIEF